MYKKANATCIMSVFQPNRDKHDKGKGTGYRPISSLKTYQQTFYRLVTGPVCSCAISTLRRAYSPAAISAR